MLLLALVPNENWKGGRGASAPVGGSLSLSLLVGKVSDSEKSPPDSGGKSEARRSFLDLAVETGAGLFLAVGFAERFAAGFAAA